MQYYSPKISIVLPSYNRAEYLSQAIGSCLAQTFTDFELIIVDDCSNDGSFNIAADFAKDDKRIKIVQNKTNMKLPTTLNIGFAKARGQYFSWISDDNLFHTAALETMNSYLDSNAEIGLVYADYTVIDSKGRIQKRIYQESPEFLPIRDCVGACFLYRANLAMQVGHYNEQMFLVEDYEYWLRLGLITGFHHINESLYFYRTHKNSLTATRKKEIQAAKNRLKEIYLPKYTVSTKHKPILDIYMWFIGKKTFKSCIDAVCVVMSHPITTIQYILKNLRRL